MDSFSKFANIVAKSFSAMADGTNQVYVAKIDPDALWEKYLASFPEGTDPIYKKNTWHNCSCCRHFIKRIGAVLTIKNGSIHTVWDAAAETAPEHYSDIAKILRDAVRTSGIEDVFYVKKNEGSFGNQKTYSIDPDTNAAKVWEHFYTGTINNKYRVDNPDTLKGDYKTTVSVLQRGLLELNSSAVESVLSLINEGALYRGEEHKRAIVEFNRIQTRFANAVDREIFLWENASNPASRFRNTVVGTLVQDLSEGVDLERAVASFESKVAPLNYKRTRALITPSMVKSAMQTIEQLGLESALQRRFATLSDVSINDVKWVNGSVKPLMKGGIGDVLMKHAEKTMQGKFAADESRAEKISMNDFMEKILPEATGMQIFFKGSQVGNLVTVTAPSAEDTKQLFRWNNDFAWSYRGGVADSIKDRVKAAGGNVVGTLRVSLSWFNFDDLDLHIIEPRENGYYHQSEISFSNKHGSTGGKLDVDMNAGTGHTRNAVENVIWTDKVPDGVYEVYVHNYTLRERIDPGFVVEIESAGSIKTFSYNKIVENDGKIVVCKLHMKNGEISKIEPGHRDITSSAISQEYWGLSTENYVDVQTVMYSPNYWGDNAVGNKHVFFILKDAKNNEDTRGFYNEFLHPRLESHRKVFEIIGEKTKCKPSEEQLSGLGFSSTKPDQILIRVQMNSGTRLFNVVVANGL